MQTKDDVKGEDLSPEQYDISTELREQKRQWESIFKIEIKGTLVKSGRQKFRIHLCKYFGEAKTKLKFCDSRSGLMDN